MKNLIGNFRNFLHDLVFGFAPPMVKKKLMSCEEITYILASKKQLSGQEKFWFSLHNFICSCCSNYRSQFQIMDIKCRQLSQHNLSEEQKTRIQTSKKDLIKNFKTK